MSSALSTRTYSISELNSIVRGLLETRMGEIKLSGEISNFSKPHSGHFYFTLKDNNAQVRCAMFKNRNLGVKFNPTNGLQVIATGRVGLYEARGDYQFIVDKLEEDGTGDLQLRFERLKKRLFAEGLFDESHKLPLPEFPKSLAIITSATGAALQDVLHVLERRYPLLNVLLFPVSVQGDAAEEQILNAFELMNSRDDVDIALLTRGGGSIEDLWVFNSELIAQAIYDCTTPIITGIGHEIDFTIADFVSDQRAPTPSAAAEIMTPDQEKLKTIFQSYQSLLKTRAQRHFDTQAQTLDWLTSRLTQLHPLKRLEVPQTTLTRYVNQISSAATDKNLKERNRLQQLEQRLIATSPLGDINARLERLIHINSRMKNTIDHSIFERKSAVSELERTISVLNPQSTLNRGYAIVTKISSNSLVGDISTIEKGDELEVRLSDGKADVKVLDTVNNLTT